MIVLISVVLLLFILLLTKSRIKLGFFEIGPAVQAAEIHALKNCIREEMKAVLHRQPVAVRDGNLEEFPRIVHAVQEERAKELLHVPRGVCETESPESDQPTPTNI